MRRWILSLRQKRSIWIIILPAVFWVFLEAAYAADTLPADVPLKKRSEIINERLDELEVNVAPERLSETPPQNEWKLSLEDCTRLVLGNNFNIKVSYLNYDTSHRDITKEEAVFDPDFTFGGSIARTESPSASETSPSRGEAVSWNAGMTQKVPWTGGTYALSFDHDRSGRKPALHSYTGDFGVDVTQPILAGFGPDVTQATLRISRNNFNIAYWDLKSQLISRVTDAQVAYWEILKLQGELSAKNLAFQQALDLVEQNKKEMSLGKRTYTDVLQAEATSASREEDVIRAQSALEAQEDALKKLLSVRDFEVWNQKIRVADTIDPEFKPVPVELPWCLETAFKKRPDYQRAIEKLKNEKINLMLAKNDLLPDLSFNFGYTLNSATNNGDTLKELFRGNYPNWDVGLAFSMPWLYRTEIAGYNQKLNALRQRQLELEDLKLQIIQEVRGAKRDLDTNVKRVQAAQLAYVLQSQKVEAETKKLSLGISTSFEVLEFQEDLVNSSVARVRAIADYHESVIRLWQTLGITLEQNGVVFDEAQKADA